MSVSQRAARDRGHSTAPASRSRGHARNDRVLLAGRDINFASLRNGRELTLSITAHEVGQVAQDLGRLKPSRLDALHVSFVEGGYFSKKNRPVLAKQMREATKKLRGVTLEL